MAKRRLPYRCGWCNTAEGLNTGKIRWADTGMTLDDALRWLNSKCRCGTGRPEGELTDDTEDQGGQALTEIVREGCRTLRIGTPVTAQFKRRKGTAKTEGTISRILDENTVEISTKRGTRAIEVEWVKARNAAKVGV